VLTAHVEEDKATVTVFGEGQAVHLDVEANGVVRRRFCENDVLFEVVVEAGPGDIEIAYVSSGFVAHGCPLGGHPRQFAAEAGLGLAYWTQSLCVELLLSKTSERSSGNQLVSM